MMAFDPRYFSADFDLAPMPPVVTGTVYPSIAEEPSIPLEFFRVIAGYLKSKIHEPTNQ